MPENGGELLPAEILPPAPQDPQLVKILFWSVKPKTGKAIRIGFAISCFGFAGWLFSNFLQLRGVVDLLASRISLFFLGVCLFAASWVFLIQTKYRKVYIALSFVTCISICVGLDWWAPKPITTQTKNEPCSHDTYGEVLLRAAQLREMQDKFKKELKVVAMAPLTHPRGSPEAHQEFLQQGEAISQLSDRQRGEFAFIRPQIALLRNRLLECLPPQNYSSLLPETRIGYERANRTIDNGFLAGNEPLSQVASYLEMLAQQLPKKN